MTEQASQPGGFDRYQSSLEGIAHSVETISRLVNQSEDGSVSTPTLYPIPFYDETGDNALMRVTDVRIDQIGHVDGKAEAVAVTLIDASPNERIYKSIAGLLFEEKDDTPGRAKIRFLATEIVETASLPEGIPSLKEFSEASDIVAEQFDDQVLYDVAFNLRALVEPWDVPCPAEQVPEALEALERSGASIPGIAYMGRLLIDPDYHTESEFEFDFDDDDDFDFSEEK